MALGPRVLRGRARLAQGGGAHLGTGGWDSPWFMGDGGSRGNDAAISGTTRAPRRPLDEPSRAEPEEETLKLLHI